MGTRVKQWLRDLWARASGKLHRPQRGQSLIIVVLALIGILALVGLSIDLGLVYVERVRVGRAADAAALAAVSELPVEPAAHKRAKVYLMENGYNSEITSTVRLVIDGAYESGPDEDAADTVLWIDTAFSRSAEGAANRIRVRIRQWVPMTFLQFIGFRRVPVEGSAEAENINNLDVVIVYDKSGSMEFDTLCYGCWDPWGTDVPGTSEGDCENPDGCLYPLKWSQVSATATPDHCETGHTIDPNYYNSGSYFTRKDEHYRANSGDRDYYIIIEAEEYSYFDLNADYHGWQYLPYRTFWVMQRNYYNFYDNRLVGALGRDSRGAYISHHPWPQHDASGNGWTGYGTHCLWSDVISPGFDGNGPYCNSSHPDVMANGGPFPAPRVDYEFTAPSGDYYHFWIRAQGGDRNQTVFWGMHENTPLRYPTNQESSFSAGAGYDAARDDKWEWERLTGGSGAWLAAGQTYVLSFWGGGAGFDLDRIIITTNGTSSNLPLRDSPPNNARTGRACEPCDARFAGEPGGAYVDMDPGAGTDMWYLPDCHGIPEPYKQEDPIYTGEQPIRDALKAAMKFVDRMDFSLDQAGYVDYDTSSHVRNKLECLRRRGPEDLDDPDCDEYWSNPGGDPPTDPDCGCFDEDFNSTIDNSVLYELNSTFSDGSTNMAGGMKDGIEVLSTQSDQYGRPGAAHIMVLMTDGVANYYPGCVQLNWWTWSPPNCNTTCPASIPCCQDSTLWPDTGSAMVNMSQDCVIYYAQQARSNSIVIYTIGLGYSADPDILKAVADITGGDYEQAPTPAALDGIFDRLFERIFVRLTD
jgi:hypothetical protein